MSRYLATLQAFLVNAIQLELAYRFNALTRLTNTAMNLTAGLVVVATLFTHTNTVGGWSLPETLGVFGTFITIQQLVDCAIAPNLGRLSEYMRTGNFDYILLRPIDSQFHVSLRNFDLWCLPGLLLGLGLIGYAMDATSGITLGRTALTLIMLLSAGAIVYSIWLLFKTTAFWFIRVENLTVLFLTILNIGRFPITAFPPAFRLLFTFGVPIAFMTTVPAEAAVGRLDWPMGVASLAMAGALLLLSRAVWRWGIRSYTSASS
jgi:ABC-2 type transport system permease protein